MFRSRLFFGYNDHDHNTPNSPKAEIKNENVTPALKQTHTDESSAVQCKTFLRNSVSMITEIGVLVSMEPRGGGDGFII